jgi:hypothetical protein
VRAIASDVEGHASSCLDALSQDDCTLQPAFERASITGDYSNTICSERLDWQLASARCPLASGVEYTVLRDTNPYFTTAVPVGNVAAGVSTFLDATVAVGTPYYYRVRPEDDLGNIATPSLIVNDVPVIGAALSAAPLAASRRPRGSSRRGTRPARGRRHHT